jgi:hypothetical protein
VIGRLRRHSYEIITPCFKQRTGTRFASSRTLLTTEDFPSMRLLLKIVQHALKVLLRKHYKVVIHYYGPVTVKIFEFSTVTHSRLVEAKRRFRITYFFHFQGRKVRQETKKITK